MVSLMILILLNLLSRLLTEGNLRRKMLLIKLILHLLNIFLLLLLMRKSRSLYLFFSHRLKKKDQAHVKKMRETFSQVKINMPLLDAIQQMPPYVRFLKDLCTTKRAISVLKNDFLASCTSSILSLQIPVKYKDPSCPTISIVTGD